MSNCPLCQTKGRTVSAATFTAQVRHRTDGEFEDDGGWRICLTPECDAIYFRGEQTVDRTEVRSVPFHKSALPNRLVCFCFEHSVADIEDDVVDGVSRIRDSIRAACKAGRDDCERKNPQGRCCLGNVGLVIKSAIPAPAEEDGADCCATQAEQSGDRPQAEIPLESTAGAGLVVSGGALAAAVMASACCWLPLVAIGVGASAAGVGTFFDAWRVPLLIATTVLMGFGFYLVYRAPRCGPGGACEKPDPRVQRFNRGVLWMTAGATLVFALFPQYVGAFGGGQADSGDVMAEQTLVRYQVQGMTCSGCEGHVRSAISEIPGVVSASVSHADGVAEVVWDGEPNHDAVVAVVSELGYEATPE